jgi:hypothetical protein
LRSNNISELIRLDTYKRCKEFTAGDFLNELKLRNWLAKSRSSDFVMHPRLGDLIWTKKHFEQFWFNKIIKGTPFAKVYKGDFCNAHLPFLYSQPQVQILKLVESPAISILVDSDFVEITKQIESQLTHFSLMEIPESRKQSEKEQLLKDPVRLGRNTLVTAIDLSFPDKLLKDAFASALSAWREELRINTSSSRAWNKNKFYNLIDYNVLFILDYLFLAQYLKVKKSTKSLCVAINDNDNNYESFMEIDYNFARNVIESKNIEILEQMIETNPRLKNSIISDL